MVGGLGRSPAILRGSPRFLPVRMVEIGAPSEGAELVRSSNGVGRRDDGRFQVGGLQVEGVVDLRFAALTRSQMVLRRTRIPRVPLADPNIPGYQRLISLAILGHQSLWSPLRPRTAGTDLNCLRSRRDQW